MLKKMFLFGSIFSLAVIAYAWADKSSEMYHFKRNILIENKAVSISSQLHDDGGMGMLETIWLHVDAYVIPALVASHSEGWAWTTNEKEGNGTRINVKKICVRLNANILQEKCLDNTSSVALSETALGLTTAWAEGWTDGPKMGPIKDTWP